MAALRILRLSLVYHSLFVACCLLSFIDSFMCIWRCDRLNVGTLLLEAGAPTDVKDNTGVSGQDVWVVEV